MDNGHTFKTVINSPHLNCLDKIQCAYESKQPTACQCVVENSTLSITENFITARDWTCIGFVIVNSLNNPVKTLELNFPGITEAGTDSFLKILEEIKESMTIEKLRIVGSFTQLPLKFLNSLHLLKILCVTMDNTTKYWTKCFSELDHPNISILHFFDNSTPKIAVKMNYLEVYSSFENAVKTLEKRYKEQSPFFTKYCKSLLSEIGTPYKCIKLSCTEVKAGAESVLVIEREDSRIITDIQNNSEKFPHYYYGSNLTSLDLISLADKKILVIPQIDEIGRSMFHKSFAIQEFIINQQSLPSYKKLLLKRIPDSMKLYMPFGNRQLQKGNIRRVSIITKNSDLKKRLSEINLLSLSIEQLHISCDAYHCSIIENFIKKLQINVFSLQFKKDSSTSFFNNIKTFPNTMKQLFNKLAHQDLHIFDLSHCYLCTDGIESSLLPALKAWSHLTELHLRNCCITSKDMNSIVHDIKMISSLHTLDLSGNNIGDEGCQALSFALCHDCVPENCSIPHLRKLNLSCCHINVKGIKFIAKVIQKKCDLELLDLSDNDCQSRAIDELFKVLKTCNKLSVLKLSSLFIRHFSVFCLLNSIPIKILHLRACEAQPSSLNSLANCPFLLSSLRVLDLSENDWPMTGLVQVLNLSC